MRRRGWIVPLVVLSALGGLVAIRRKDTEARRAEARAAMAEMVKAIGILKTMGRPWSERREDLDHGADYPADPLPVLEPGPDPWGNEYEFERTGRAFTITCLGADGAPGGDGADEDIVVRVGESGASPASDSK